jgi:hypothetical protein
MFAVTQADGSEIVAETHATRATRVAASVDVTVDLFMLWCLVVV